MAGDAATNTSNSGDRVRVRTSVGSGAAGKAATAAVDRDAKNEKAGRAAAAALGIPPKKKK